jgi:hypothetical protein
MTFNKLSEPNFDADAAPTADEIAAHYGWLDVKPSVRGRDDVRPVLTAIDELRELDNELLSDVERRLPPGKQPRRAAARVRWALDVRGSLCGLKPLARNLLTLVLDTINTKGFVGWRNWASYATELRADPANLSRAVGELVEKDLIRATGSHRTRLVWSNDQHLIVAGNSRGPSYTFGLAGYPSFHELIANYRPRAGSVEVVQQTSSNSDAAQDAARRTCLTDNFNSGEVVSPTSSIRSKLSVATKQEDQGSFDQPKPKGSKKLKSADAPAASSTNDLDRVGLAGSTNSKVVIDDTSGLDEALSGSGGSDVFSDLEASHTTATTVPAIREQRAPMPVPLAPGRQTALDLEGGASIHGVELPSTVAAIVESGKAPAGRHMMNDEIKDALSRGVTAETIRHALGLASANAERWCEENGKKFSPHRVYQFAAGDLNKLKPAAVSMIGSDGQTNDRMEGLRKLFASPKAMTIGRDWVTGDTLRLSMEQVWPEIRDLVEADDFRRAEVQLRKAYTTAPPDLPGSIAGTVVRAVLFRSYGDLSKQCPGPIWKAERRGMWAIPKRLVDKLLPAIREDVAAQARQSGDDPSDAAWIVDSRLDTAFEALSDMTGIRNCPLPMVEYGHGLQGKVEAMFEQAVLGNIDPDMAVAQPSRLVPHQQINGGKSLDFSSAGRIKNA